jgi:hypothetical protein
VADIACTSTVVHRELHGEVTAQRETIAAKCSYLLCERNELQASACKRCVLETEHAMLRLPASQGRLYGEGPRLYTAVG